MAGVRRDPPRTHRRRRHRHRGYFQDSRQYLDLETRPLQLFQSHGVRDVHVIHNTVPELGAPQQADDTMIIGNDRENLQVWARSDVPSLSQVDNQHVLMPRHVWIIKILDSDLGLHDVKHERINENLGAEREEMLE